MVVCAVDGLQKKGRRVERLLKSIDEDIAELQKGKQDLKYDIEDFYAQLTAANICQQHEVHTANAFDS